MTSFIVDIESLGQSYLVRDYYSKKDPSETGLYDYTTQVICLDKSYLKYGDFDCRDRISFENGLPRSDPLFDKLPYQTENYKVTMNGYDISKKGNLVAEIYTEYSDDKLATTNYAEGQLKIIREWIRSQGVDERLYNLNYVIIYRQD
jgi:hypothetical protein